MSRFDEEPEDLHGECRNEIRNFEAQLKAAEQALVLIGERAVVDWDDETVGDVDAIVKNSERYVDWLKEIVGRAKRTEAAEERAEKAENELSNATITILATSHTSVEKGLRVLLRGCNEETQSLHRTMGVYEKRFNALRAQLAEAERDRDKWKVSCIRYQTIVYNCCKGKGVTEHDVVDHVAQIRAERAAARARVRGLTAALMCFVNCDACAGDDWKAHTCNLSKARAALSATAGGQKAGGNAPDGARGSGGGGGKSQSREEWWRKALEIIAEDVRALSGDLDTDALAADLRALAAAPEPSEADDV